MINFLQPLQPLYDYLTVEIPINIRLLLLMFHSRCFFTEVFLGRVLAFTLGRVLTFDVGYLVRSGLLVLTWVCAGAGFLAYVSAVGDPLRPLFRRNGGDGHTVQADNRENNDNGNRNPIANRRRRPQIDWSGLFLKTVIAGITVVCCMIVTRKWMGVFVSPFELMRLAVSEEGVCVPLELFKGSY
ncbi:hypothetical protein GE09DRAFT_1210099 [Coniochaeta sp. 2T2.1]|nr:hypothetical protein GE09DRAFT_1210099 [Coniochaeta sp. 2T2.1]